MTKRRPARFKVEPPILSASGAHIFTAKEGEIASGASDPWLAVAIVRVVGRTGDEGIKERDLVDLAEAEVLRMSIGRLMAEGRLTESWNGSDFEYREP